MTHLLQKNPKTPEAQKIELKKNVTKRVTESHNNAFQHGKFKSRVAKASASVVTYHWTKLALAEIVLSQSGFPRLTLQWGAPLASSWNQATRNILVSSWLDCYNAKGVPLSYIIDENSLEVPRLAKEILTQWVQGKRSLYSQQAKEKQLVGEEGRTEKLRKKLMSEKEKRAMRD